MQNKIYLGKVDWCCVLHSELPGCPLSQALIPYQLCRQCLLCDGLYFQSSGVGQVNFLVKHPIHLAAAGCACRSFGMPSICLSYFWEACHKNRSRIYTTPKISDPKNIYSTIQAKFLPEMAVDLSSILTVYLLISNVCTVLLSLWSFMTHQNLVT